MYDLSKTKGNAFSILAYTAKALAETGLEDLVENYKERAIAADYQNLLSVSLHFIAMANSRQKVL